ncbi:FunK1 protein kinase [Arthroderma uncinatum]|uniref:FunK1 protein kinase n=1 Tax=Arthroderma uncinatum TaxID=74035 RepID=UPI00144A7C0C|nr:FunK1 protein kinase [Arthroderma uncinatum]KAF3484327.1 FunK1 protein kinase [Arthroderma uncinatum]
MSPSRSEIISSHPIGDRLDAFKDLYNAFISEEETSRADINDRLLDLILALQSHPVCRKLPLTGREPILDGLARVLPEVRQGTFDAERFLPLLKAIHDNDSDESIWSKVTHAIAELTPSPLPLCSFQTPLTRNTGSVVNSSELRTNMNAVLREDLGDMYVDIPKFYETFFGYILGLQTNAQAVFERCKEGEEPLFHDGAG